MIRTVRSEIIKIRSTSTWWLMGLGLSVITALALTLNLFVEHNRHFAHPEQEEVARTTADVAANIYTSGQFFGAMMIMILGSIVVTNEFFHQTATTTFLATPHRTQVIIAKFIAAGLFGVCAWLLTTALSLPTGAIYLGTEHVSASLGEWVVQQSILLNLAVYVLWAIFGVGLGVLIRSQVGSLVTGAVGYLIGTYAAAIVFVLVRTFLIKEDWVDTSRVILPAIASEVMTTPGKAFPHAPQQWVGAAVLIGYALVFGLIGTLITRRRDIS